MIGILSIVGPLFIIILAGALARILKITESRWVEVLNKFALYLGFAPLIIYNLAHASRAEFLNKEIIIANFALLIGTALLLWFLVSVFRLKLELANSYILAIFMGNFAYLGFPFITKLYPASASMVSLLIAIHLIVLLTLVLTILDRKSFNKKKIPQVFWRLLSNPLLLAVIIGLILLFARIQIPNLIDESLRLLAQSSSPVVLVAIGVFLAQKISFNTDFWHAILISLAKLLILPLIFFVAWKIFNFSIDFRPSVLESAMPVAVTVFAFAEIYPLKKTILANSIIISTIFSVITLTAWAMVVR